MAAAAVNATGWTVLGDADRPDIQGIVTTGYGHLPFAGYVFARFAGAEAAAEWLGALVPQVTTAAPWQRRDGEKLKPESTLNVALAYAGLELLGIPDETRRTLPVELRD